MSLSASEKVEVIRILKPHDLGTSPAYIPLSASDLLHSPTKRINAITDP